MRANYLRDRNRFGLAKPPQWWLRALAEFDDSLVIIPSRVDPLYRIAQRRPSVDLPIASHLDRHPDTAMLTAYGLVPVTTILSTTGGWVWSAHVFQQLAARCGWRQNLTPEQTADMADKADVAEKVARHAARDDRLDHQLKHMREIALWHTGRKLLLDDPLKARWTPRALSASPSGSTAPSHG